MRMGKIYAFFPFMLYCILILTAFAGCAVSETSETAETDSENYTDSVG